MGARPRAYALTEKAIRYLDALRLAPPAHAEPGQGFCRKCLQPHHLDDGLVRWHGDARSACPGSARPPLEMPNLREN